MQSLPQPEPPVTLPAACPFCRSAAVTTTSKVISPSTYWRCTACGQIWNVERLRPPSRYGGYRP